MLRTVQFVHALNGNQVRADAADVGSHAVQHVAQLLQVRLTSGIIYGSRAFGDNGSHNNVGRACHRGLVEQHVTTLQLLGGNLVYVTVVQVLKLGTQIFESQEVSVQTPAPYLVTARLGDDSFTESCQQRTDHQHAATQCGALPHKLVAFQIG